MKIRFDVSQQNEQTFQDFLNLCKIRGLKAEDGFLEASILQLQIHEDEFKKTWMSWDELQEYLSFNGHQIARTAFYNARKTGVFDHLIRTSGIRTVYDAEAILRMYQMGDVENHAMALAI